MGLKPFCLHSEFQDSKAYIDRPCFKKLEKNEIVKVYDNCFIRLNKVFVFYSTG